MKPDSRTKALLAVGVVVLTIVAVRAALDSPDVSGPRGVVDRPGAVTTADVSPAEVTPGTAADSRAAATSRVTPAPYTLSDSDTLSVQIVDSTGEPREGVDVALLRIDRSPDALLWRGQTGSDGIAAVPSWPKLRARLAASAVRSIDPSVDDLAFLPLTPAPAAFPRTSFSSRAAPSEPVVAALPPTDDVRVRVVDAEGRLVTSPVLVAFGAEIPRPPLHSEHDEIIVEREVLGGEATLIVPAPAPHRLPLRASPLDGAWLDFGSVSWPVISVTDASEHLFTIQLKRSVHRIVGRAVIADGTPLRRSRLHVDVEGSSEWRVNEFCTTDGNGAFEIGIGPMPKLGVDGEADAPADSSTPSADHGAAVLVLMSTDHASLGATGRSAPQVIGPQATVIDLGAVVLNAPQLIASGRVVDSRGNPIAGAEVLAAEALGNSMRALPGEREPWAVTERDGTFRLVSSTTMTGSVYLRARHAGHLMRRSLAIASGAEEVLITLVENGHVTWRSETSGAGSAVLRFRDAATDRMREVALANDHAGSVELAPGRYSVDIRPGGDGRAVVHLDDILVEDGATVAPPSLNPIDWTRLLRTCRIVVSLPTGGPAVGARVALTQTEVSTTTLEAMTGNDGVASLDVPLGRAAFNVTLDGYCDALVSVEEEGAGLALASVRLRAAPAVRVVVPQHNELAVGGRRVLVGINGTIASRRPAAYVGEAGDATLRAPGLASATVVVEIVVPGLAAPILADWRWVQIKDDVTVVEARFDANQLRAIAEVIRRERAAAGLPPE